MNVIIEDISNLTDSKEIMNSKEPISVNIAIYSVVFVLVIAVIFSNFFYVEETINMNGIIKTYDATTDFTIKVAGNLKEINVKEGQYVEKGTILFKVDTSLLETQLISEEAKFEEISKNISYNERLVESIKQGKNLFDSANSEENIYYNKFEYYIQKLDTMCKDALNQNSESKNVNEQLKNSKDIIKINIDNYNLRINEYNKMLELLENPVNYDFTNDYIKVEYETYMYQYTEYCKNREALQKEFDKIQLDTKKRIVESIEQLKVTVADLNKEMESIKTNMNSKDVLVDVEEIKSIYQLENILSIENENSQLRMESASVDTNINIIKKNIEESTYKANCSGRVFLLQNKKNGDYVNAGDIFIQIIPKSEYIIEAYIPESEKSLLKKHQEVYVSFESLPEAEYGKIKGKIKTISENVISTDMGMCYVAQIELNKKYVRSKYDSKKRKIYVGMIAKVSAITKSKKLITKILECLYT